jgi:hypothetical protein
MCGICGALGIGGGAHGDPAAGAVAGGGAAAGGMPCPPCKSRSAEPEITRVNSPGPDDTGGGGPGGIEGGVAHGEAAGCAGGAAANGAGAGAANGDGAGPAGGNDGGAAGGAADAPGCASDCSSCVKPPAAAGAAGGGGGAGDGEIGPNEFAASGAGSLGFGSWFNACSNCVNPPAAAGACGGAAGVCGVEIRSPLSGSGSCFSDLSGSSCGVTLAPWLANIFVNAPGSDCAADPAPGPGEDCHAACGEGGCDDTGPDVLGAIPPGLENIRVNSPGAALGLALVGGGASAGEVGAAAPPVPCTA